MNPEFRAPKSKTASTFENQIVRFPMRDTSAVPKTPCGHSARPSSWEANGYSRPRMGQNQNQHYRVSRRMLPPRYIHANSSPNKPKAGANPAMPAMPRLSAAFLAGSDAAVVVVTAVVAAAGCPVVPV